MLFVHGTRAALNAASRLEAADKSITQLQACSLNRARESHRNKATVAVPNKMVRIAWAVWYHEREFNGNHVIRVAARCRRFIRTGRKTLSAKRLSPDVAHSEQRVHARAVGSPSG
jgi:hypothetical protein